MTEEQEPKPRLRPIDILESMKGSAPVFVGFSPRGPAAKPVEIKRWGQFIVKFGSFKKCGYLATSVNGFFSNGGKVCYVLNLGERPGEIIELKARFEESLKTLESLDDIPFILAPGEFEPEVHDAMIAYCEGRGTYALLDGPEELIEVVKEAPEEAPQADGPMEGAGEDQMTNGQPDDEGEKYENLPFVVGDHGTLIYPWIYLKDRVLGNFYIPPSGHVAGILCRLHANNERPRFSNIEGTVLLKYKFPAGEIEAYKGRGITFLQYPTKAPGLLLE